MAHDTYLRILEQGVETWNLWRKEVASQQEAALREQPPNGWTGVIRVIDLRDANLSEANLVGVDLSEASLGGANLTFAKLKRARLNDADLTRANLRLADLEGADLSRALLHTADLVNTNSRSASFHEASLNEAQCARADFLRADFTGASLIATNFAKANLVRANFAGATTAWTVFADVDLSSTEGLESVEHRGPSSVGIDAVYASHGYLPEVFLRGAGVSDDFIVFARSLAARPIEYYSCFISDSARDQDFADRLYADLQARGVRCWFAPEDMKIGDKIWDRLDQSIRLHDKLLVVLSANSIGSDWVEDEVTTAFEEERRRGKTVLFPVRLDDTVFSTPESWAAKVRQRHIGDFSRWKDHDAYKKALDRLLRDLKAEGQQATTNK